MGSINVKIKVEFNRFDEIRGRMRTRAGQIVRKTAFDIQRDYQQNARRDTGAQVNSAYVVTRETSTYAEAAALARTASPDVLLLPEVPNPDPFTAIVAVAAAYGRINEYGGETGPDGEQRRSGDGAMTQAAANNRAPFRAAMQKLLEP
jgi:hypothetical protein